MHIWIHSGTFYLNETKARSLNGDSFYLLEKPELPTKPNDNPPKSKIPVLINIRIIDAVMSSVHKYENGSGFINRKYAVPLRDILHEIGHIQGPTPMQFYNIVTNCIITDTVLQGISKAMDVRFYWLCDQCQFF